MRRLIPALALPLLLSSVPTFAEEPHIVPVAPGATVTAEVQSYLLPESKYDSCLVKALTLRGVEDALAACHEEGTRGLVACQERLAIVQEERQEEDDEYARLTTELQLTKDQIERLKHQRNLALVGTGGVALTLLALALGGVFGG